MRSRVTKVLAWTGCILILIGACGYFSMALATGIWGGETERVDRQYAVSAAGVQTLTIQGQTIDIHVIPTDGSQITVHEYGTVNNNTAEDYQAKSTTNDGNTVIQLQRSSATKWYTSIGGLANLQMTADVQVPKSIVKELTISDSTGDVDVRGVSTDTFVCTGATGDLSLNNFHGTEAQITLATGDVTLTNVNSTLNVRSSTGDVNASFSTIQHDVTLTTNTGDVQIRVVNPSQTIGFNLVSNTGDLKVNLPSIGLTETSNQKLTANTGHGPLVTASTNTGDITVN